MAEATRPDLEALGERLDEVAGYLHIQAIITSGPGDKKCHSDCFFVFTQTQKGKTPVCFYN